jgi:hypothetical protein
MENSNGLADTRQPWNYPRVIAALQDRSSASCFLSGVSAHLAPQVAQIVQLVVIELDKRPASLVVNRQPRLQSGRSTSGSGKVGAPIQQFGRVAPDRLARGIANVATCQPDVGKQALILIGKNGDMPAMFDGPV